MASLNAPVTSLGGSWRGLEPITCTNYNPLLALALNKTQYLHKDEPIDSHIVAKELYLSKIAKGTMDLRVMFF